MTTFSNDISVDVPIDKDENKEKKKLKKRIEFFQGFPVYEVEPEDFSRNLMRDRYKRYDKYEDIVNHIRKNKNYDFWIKNKVTGEMYHNSKFRRK